MADELLKKVRVNDGIFVEVYQQGKRKYTILNDNGVEERGEKSRDPQTDDYFINEALRLYAIKKGKPNDFYKVIQDPYKDPEEKRVFGTGDKNPYYLNNGCKVNIQWLGKIPNPDFVLGTFSNPEEADYLGAPIDRYLDNQPIYSNEDSADIRSKLLPISTWVVAEPFQMGLDNQSNPAMTEPNYRDRPFVYDKIVTINFPDGVKEEGEYLVLTNMGLTYNTKAVPASSEVEYINRPLYQITEFGSSVKDYDIVKQVIEKFKTQVTSIHGISYNDYNLQLCSPDTGSCSVIPYKSPVLPENKPVVPDEKIATPEYKPSKLKLTIDGLSDPVLIKVKTNLDTFTIWAGEIPKPKDEVDQYDDSSELDSEYLEGSYSGLEEESPQFLPEVSASQNNVTDPSTTDYYTPDPNAKPGVVVSLPKNYSHTSEQGYNILNSQWIGDLIASAKSHIGHPTYDISGTEKGNLGCASAVSMMFYRAFGVHMKTGKPVKPKPTDIGSFGTKGTGEAAGWFLNTSLYQKIPWKEAQPGDIINTARNGEKAGHIGVVIDVKDKNGSWAIVSNSSKGFAGGGGGAVKQNYSVKAWQSVTDRNPTQTFAFRYIGPRLSPGQTA